MKISKAFAKEGTEAAEVSRLKKGINTNALMGLSEI
jgi:hypothetical protein